MNSNQKNQNEEIILDLSPAIRLYKHGRVERLPNLDPPPVSPSLDPKTGVNSKDIKISTVTGVRVRLFKPKIPQNPIHQNRVLPLLLYFHGGGFLLESTFSAKYHKYLNRLAFEARAMIVSVEYRRAPEHRLPVSYHDCWDALKWVLTTTESWIQDHVDFSRVYLMGDSAGGNIAHRTAVRVGTEGICEGRAFRLNGIILVHPYFWGKDRIGEEGSRSYHSIPDLPDKVWAFARPSTSYGPDHPWINPANDPCLSSLGCQRVLMCIAEKDVFRDRGLYYKEVLEKSGWQGNVEVVESKGEDHVFHLMKPFSNETFELMRKIVAFLHPARCTL